MTKSWVRHFRPQAQCQFLKHQGPGTWHHGTPSQKPCSSVAADRTEDNLFTSRRRWSAATPGSPRLFNGTLCQWVQDQQTRRRDRKKSHVKESCRFGATRKRVMSRVVFMLGWNIVAYLTDCKGAATDTLELRICESKCQACRKSCVQSTQGMFVGLGILAISFLPLASCSAPLQNSTSPLFRIQHPRVHDHQCIVVPRCSQVVDDNAPGC